MKSLAQLKAESKIETLLRKREKADDERVFSQIAKEREELEARKRARTPSVRTMASFIAGERSKQKNFKAMQVRLKKQRDDLPNDGILLVLRIHVSVHAANPVKKALATLRLKNRYAAVLVKISPEVYKLLQIVEPFIIYGKPTQQIVDKLVRKRGKVVRNGIEMELKDNNWVEEALENFGMLCIDDLVYELANGTENFDKAALFLSPFKLNLPQKKFKKTPFSKGGDYGFREDINLIVESMI
ncbi:hypothetical protein SteCoe_131 [Stentor coeruleus]|uniref:Ribosomal protein L30 ferredoxin-like fold domain-containing protein n=1 Tax=Stentor coeruleus TaxID=5963 RepID=A0A1R2D523_9CILI|nr:hypothetical protein SteCoe_131 [Stentor coeruleus]